MSEQYQLSDIALNNGQNGRPFWLIIGGCVYDVTQFRNEHPGGVELISEYAGQDATKAFNGAGHSYDAIKLLKQFRIGDVTLTQQPTTDTDKAVEPEAKQTPVEQPKKDGGSGFFCCC